MYRTPVLWVFRITQWFWDRIPFYKPWTTKWHPWLDYAHTKRGVKQTVLASNEGIVVQSSELLGWWQYIVILHPDWMETIYAHLSKRLVIVGNTVVWWQEIWITWTTGKSTGIHLHFWIRPNKRSPEYNQSNWFAWWLDPNDYLNKYILNEEDEELVLEIMRLNSETRDKTKNLDLRYTLEQHNDKFRSKFWL